MDIAKRKKHGAVDDLVAVSSQIRIARLVHDFLLTVGERWRKRLKRRNMVIHSDFMVNGVLKVEKYDDCFVLTNPGLLKLPIEQIYKGGESKARNQRMQNMFRMIGYGENLGSGFPLILNAWNEKHWIKPELQEQPELMQVK